jgi:hypothetical protein
LVVVVVVVMVVVAVRMMLVVCWFHINDTGKRRAHVASAVWRLLSALYCLLSGVCCLFSRVHYLEPAKVGNTKKHVYTQVQATGTEESL